MMAKIGIALGGGGAKGLAHVPILEVFEELGVGPACVAGTSIGAIVGVLYCSGIPPSETRRDLAAASLSGDEGLRDLLGKREILKWLDFARFQFDRSGLLRSDRVMDVLFSALGPRRFEDLKTPLKVVATDFWAREPVVFEQGELIPALKASMAVPGVFPPVEIDGRLLADGGMVNPIPYDLLPQDCEITIAVDVAGRRTPSSDAIPSMMDLVFNAFQIAARSITREKLRRTKPDIYVEPDITDIRLLEFYKAGQIFTQAQSAKDQFKRELESKLSRF
jgi:NTE family protein